MEIRQNIQNILNRINLVAQKSNITGHLPQLIAVSKLKPVSDILEAYNCGQRDFGENYVQELELKSNQIIYNDLKWHFIGHLQRNKINKIANIPYLYMIHTVDSEMLAKSLDLVLGKKISGDQRKLKILLQVNTSSEKGKNGINPNNVPSLAKYIIKECTNLDFSGLMTIGSLKASNVKHCLNNPNPDFLTLVNCRHEVAQHCNLDEKSLNLSMGMSHDYEHAIEMGATYVRIGTTIFGERK